MPETLLLLGGSHAEVPLIRAAQSLGLRVITTGNKQSDLGHLISDAYIAGDFSNIDEMLEIARGAKIDFVCSGCNDFAAITAASIAHELDLPGHDTPQLTQVIHHKNSFYSFADKLGVPVPTTVNVTSRHSAREAARRIGFPVIIKPVDLTGGKGVSTAYSESDLDSAWSKSQLQTRQNSVVVQKLVLGTNHAASVLIVDNKVKFCFIDNEHYYDNPFLVGGASFPSTLSTEIQSEVQNSIERLLSEERFVDGIFHLQFIVDKNLNHFFIDVCRRSPGDLYIQFVQESTGINYPELIVKAALGLPIQIDKEIETRRIGRLCLMPSRNGHFESVKDLDGPGTVLQRTSITAPGTIITDFRIQKIEILQIAFDTMDEMLMVMNTPTSRFSVLLK